jgi:hypothetical protein
MRLHLHHYKPRHRRHPQWRELKLA